MINNQWPSASWPPPLPASLISAFPSIMGWGGLSLNGSVSSCLSHLLISSVLKLFLCLTFIFVEVYVIIIPALCLIAIILQVSIPSIFMMMNNDDENDKFLTHILYTYDETWCRRNRRHGSSWWWWWWNWLACGLAMHWPGSPDDLMNSFIQWLSVVAVVMLCHAFGDRWVGDDLVHLWHVSCLFSSPAPPFCVLSLWFVAHGMPSHVLLCHAL